MSSNSTLTLALMVVASVARSGCASSFLQTQPRPEQQQVTKDEVEEALLAELFALSSASHLSSIEEVFRPMYRALPKSDGGKLGPSTVRYALHRYFVQEHGWYVNGLDPAGGAWASQSTASIMKARAPSYIQDLLEKRLHGHGLGLKELAVFAATLSDLIHKEAVGTLTGIYNALQLPTVGPVDEEGNSLAVKAYLVAFLIGSSVTVANASDVATLEEVVIEMYPAWQDTLMWAQDLRNADDFAKQSGRNPFVQHSTSFREASVFVKEIAHNFGSFQKLECHALKDALVDMEHQGSGRVLLSRFYSGGLEGDWQFAESVDYLRNLGALDETDPRRPSVVIPNYINSQTNCLTSSGFYSVCCSDQCEGLLSHVELEIAAPSAVPARIAEVVASLESDTVSAPRNLSSSLLARLEEIADLHQGRVPLHGRLFAQWMHHAYPRECSFPHAAGTTSPVSPDEWMAVYGVDSLEASEEEMKMHVMSVVEGAAGVEPDALPWIALEELLVQHRAHKARSTFTSLRAIMALVVVVSLGASLAHSSRTLMSSLKGKCVGGKPDRFLV